MTPPRIGWYGDDFTGATDTLAVLTQAGLRAMLFLGVPSSKCQAAAELALGGPLDAIGIAGAARAMAPAAMEHELEPVGAYFASLQVPVLHYKVCSTFDSAPGVGSIGVAARVLGRHAANAFLPIVGGQPSLGRYCVFSNLFAAAGRGGAIERIDRHPTMRNHPSTPMAEADLRKHLALQGLETTALHYPAYAQAVEPAQGAMLLDVADESNLPAIGRLIWQEAQRERLLAIGASSVAQALIAHWQLQAPVPASLPTREGPVLVLAGSLSPVTARQVQAAKSFVRFQVSPAQLLDEASAGAVASSLARALRQGHNVLAVTAPPDGTSKDAAGGAEIAKASARFLKQVLRQHPLRRVGIAGGDTSSLAVQELGAWGLSYAGTLGPGVALSRVHHDDPALDGLVVMLKGGQMGGEDVFEQLAR